MSQSPAVSVEGLGKTFRQGLLKSTYHAVRDINLTMQPGEVWAMAGPNGAGKTTTLHCIAGLLWPTVGDIKVLGTTPRLARSRLGFQTEIFFTYPHLTCAQALKFYAKLSGLQGAPLQAAIDRTLERVGLRHAADRRVGGFSKGMVQRLGLAQSIIHDPELVIWDEPTTGLDPEGRALVFELIADMRARSKSVILSTHIIDDIQKVCSHMAIIAGGALRLADTIDAVCTAYPGQTLEQVYVSRVKESVDER